MIISFGALSPKLSKQLGLSQKDGGQYDKDADAICRLSIRGILSDKEVQHARTRLLKRITCDLKPSNKK